MLRERTRYLGVIAIPLALSLPLIVLSAVQFRDLGFEFLLFTAFILAGDLLEMRLPFGSCTLSGAPIVAAILLMPRYAVIISVVICSLAEGMIHHKTWYRTLYNIMESAFSVAIAWTVYRLLGGGGWPLLSAQGLPVALTTVLAYFFSNLGLWVVSFLVVRRGAWSEIWSKLLVPVLPIAPLEGILGITLAAIYQSGGPISFVLFTALLAVSYSSLRSSSIRAQNKDLSAKYDDTQAYMRDLVAGMTNGVVAVDRERKVTMVNRAAEELLGHRAPELLGKDVGELQGTLLPPMLEGALEGGGTRARGIELESDEKRLDIICSVSALHDASGRPSGAVAVLQDVTEQKEIERRLGHLDRLALMGEFAAGVVHEVNNPLALVSMALDGAKGSLAEGETADVVQHIELAQRNVSRLEKLSRRLLSFSRPVPMAVSPLDVGSTLNEVLDIVAPQARTARVRVTRQVPVGLELLAEASSLQQVFLNLAANAIQAMPEGGTLHVSAGRMEARLSDVVTGTARGEGLTVTAGLRGASRAVRVLDPLASEGLAGDVRGLVWVQFTDTGVGMSPEALRRLGQSFFTTKEQGTGLGVAVVCKILAQYRGVMEVWSEPGAGTTFRLWFPELTPAELGVLEFHGRAGRVEYLSVAEEPTDLMFAAREAAAAGYGTGPLSGWTGLGTDLPALGGRRDAQEGPAKK